MKTLTLVGLLFILIFNNSWASSERKSSGESSKVFPIEISIAFPLSESASSGANDAVRLRFRNTGLQGLKIKKIDPTALVPDVFAYSLNTTDPDYTRLTPLQREVRGGYFRKMLHEIETTLKNPDAFLVIPPGGDYEIVLNLALLRRAFESAPTGKALFFNYRVPKLILGGSEVGDVERFNNYMTSASTPTITIRNGRWELFSRKL